MTDISRLTAPAPAELFFRREDPNDVRLGEIVLTQDYETAEIVILGCPQDEGVARNKGRIGAALAPDAIRRQFYKLSNFGISVQIFDIGNTIIAETLEETHDRQTEIVRRLLRDGKKIISLGGGNDVSYPDCRALSEEVGASNVLAFNIDAHFDVRADSPRNSGTPYRQLLEENWIEPQNFCEVGYQSQSNSPVYFQYLREKSVSLFPLETFGDSMKWIRRNLAHYELSQSNFIFWGFDVDAVRAADAPGVSAPSSIGLTADDFVSAAAYAGSNSMTRIIEFTETNPNFDVDNRTAKLVAIAMHRFCQSVSSLKK